MSHKNIAYEFTSVSCKSDSQECPTIVSCKSVPQGEKSVARECERSTRVFPTRVSKHVWALDVWDLGHETLRSEPTKL